MILTPDLTTFGKIIGGGLPVGAYGGRARYYGNDRAVGKRLSSRNFVGKSAGDDGRTRNFEDD